MKELSTEEKAKRYDEALKRAKKILEFYKHPAYSEVYTYAKEDIPGIFPELVENEDKDEKMRKNCIHFLELQKSHHAATFEIEECIDWLENQKEPEDKGEISDGYHTFNELYRYRMLYNAAFFNLLPKHLVHKSKRHHDGEECFGGGWFIVMANLPTGQISNHYELKDWDLFQIPEKEIADEWDGHTPQEAAERLHEYLFKTWNEQIPTFPFEQKHFKQSECEMDEIVRKELIDAINGLWNDDALPMPLSVKRKNAWLAWLEKQGEKKPVEWSGEEQQIIEDAACVILDCVNTADTKEEEERLEELADKLQDLKPYKQGKSIIKAWKDMRCEVYAQASGNRHEPNCSDNNTEMFSLNDIDEIIEKIATGNIG